MRFKTINPATEELIKEYETQDKEDIFKIVNEAQYAFNDWKSKDISERAKYMRKLSQVLRRGKNEFAETITTEMGKPIKQSLAEVEKCAWTAEIYAENSEKWLEEEIIQADGKKHIVMFEPLGIILSIMPWNFPFWQAFRFAIPALMAGNVSILKHSNMVTGCSLAIESVFKDAGFDNVFSSIITEHETVSELIKHNSVDGISLTGSVSAGMKIASLAGQHIKKCVLELGGSDPFIVFDDADIESAAKAGVMSRMLNTGQSCISAKRFIVVKSKEKEFTERFVEFTKNLKTGDPMDENTDIGPLVSARQRDELEEQLADSVNAGAMLLTGGRRLSRKGFFFEPTVVINVNKTMRVLSEEVFGPVAPIIPVKDENEAIILANDSEFGLGASIWTRDEQKALNIAEKINAGCVFINSLVKSDPRVPFGGIKKSGIGRELSHYGIKEFVNIKSINSY